MNNAVELAGLPRGITLAKDHGFSALSVEGDSQLIIRGLQKILNGVKDDKVSHNWRLSHGLSELGGMVTSLAAIIPEQIRRKENLVADCMANLGVMLQESHRIW
jgi:ribonuclease HI